MSDPSSSRLFRQQTLLGAIGVYLPATAAGHVIGLVRGIVLAWLMTRAQFGLYHVALLVINVLAPLTGVAAYEGLHRYVPAHENRGRLAAFLSRGLPVTIAVALAGAALVFIFGAPLGSMLFAAFDPAGAAAAPVVSRRLTRLAAVASFTLVTYLIALAVLRGLRMFRALSGAQVAHALLFTIAAVAAAALGARSAADVIGLYALASIAIAVPVGVGLARLLQRWPEQQRPLAGEPTIGPLLRFSAWAALAAVLWQVSLYFPLWYLQKSRGPEPAAVFAAMRHVTQVVWLACAAVVAVVTPLVTRTWEDRGREHAAGPEAADRQLALATKTCGLAALLLSAVFVVGRGSIVRIYPAGYAAGAPAIPLLLLFFLLVCHLGFLAIHFHLIEKPRLLLYPWSAALVANVIFAAWFLQLWGGRSPVVAAAAAGVAAYGIALVACLFVLAAVGRRIGTGVIVVIVAAPALLLSPAGMWGVIAVLILACVATDRVFTADDRRQLASYVAQCFSRLPGWREHRG